MESKTYSKAEVIELAKEVLGAELDARKAIPLHILDSLGLYREWTHYKEVGS